ncbi:MAG: hypothetical protein K2M95_04400 [Clostridiales bacterium]|nr:hypothetical protein [Clostridiales bacterium]
MNNLTYEDGVLSFTLTTQSGNSFAVRLEHDDVLRSLSIGGTKDSASVRLSATLSEDSGAPVSLPQNAEDVAALTPWLEKLQSLTTAEGVRITLLPTTLGSGDDALNVSGEVTLARTEKGVNAEALLTVNGNEVHAYYVDNTLYVQAGEAAFSLSAADIESTIADLKALLIQDKDEKIERALQSLQATLALVKAINPSFAGSPDSQPLMPAIEALSLREDKLLVSLSFGGTTVTASLAGASVLTANLTVSGEHTANFTVTAEALGPTAIDAPSGEFTDLKAYLAFLPPLTNTLLQEKFEIHVSGSLTKQTESGVLRDAFEAELSAQNNRGAFEIMGNIKVAGVSLDFMFVRNTVYLRTGNLAVRLHLSDTQTLAEAVIDILSDESVRALLGMTVGDANNTAAVMEALSSVLPPLNFNGVTALLSGAYIENGTFTVGDETYDEARLVLPVSPENGVPYELALGVANGALSSTAIRGLTAGNIQIDVYATLDLSASFTIDADDEDYVDLSLLTSFAAPVKALLGADALNMQISDGLLKTSLLSGDLSGSVLLSLEPLQVQAALNFGEHTVSFVYTGEGVMFVAIDNIKLTFTADDVAALIAQIKSFGEKSGLDDEQLTALTTVLNATAETASLLDTLLPLRPADLIGYLAECKQSEDANGNKIDDSLTVAFATDKLAATVVLTASGNALSIKLQSFSYGNVVYDSSACVLVSPHVGFTAAAENANSYVGLRHLQSYIDPVMNTIEQSQFTVSLSGTVTGSDGVQTSANGVFKARPTEHFADLQLSLAMTQGTAKTEIVVTIIDGGAANHSNVTGYVSYKGPSYKKAFVASVDYKSALQMIAAACDILNVHIELIDNLMAKNNVTMPNATVFDTLDIKGLDGLREKIGSIFEKTEGADDAVQGGASGIAALVDEATINSVLKGISLTFGKITEDENEPDRLHIRIDNSLIGGDDSLARISIGHNGNTGSDAFLTYIDVENLTAGGMQVNAFTATLDCSEEAFGTLTAPAVDYDFSSLDELLIALINTANLKEFEITGALALNIPVIGNISVPFVIDVKILGDGSTVAAIKFEVPHYSNVLGIFLGSTTLLNASDSYLYFVNDRLYFIVDHLDKNRNYQSTETDSATIDEFLANPTKYLFMLLNLSSGIRSTIEDAMQTENGKGTDDLTQILKSYTCENGVYTLKVGLAELAGNKNLSDLTLTVNASNSCIRGLNVQTKFVNLITLGFGNGASLVNVAEKTENGKTVYYSKGISPVSYGHAAPADIDTDLTNIEDSLARIFPVEAAETFAVKTAGKAEKATDAASDAANASKRVADALSALRVAEANAKAATEKVDSIPKGSFGYDRAVAAKAQADKAKIRAEEKCERALGARVESARDALAAAKEAYKYASKAAKAAKSALDASTEIRAAQAAAESANAALLAIDAAKEALEKAEQAAIDAGTRGETVLAEIRAFKADMQDGNDSKQIEKLQTVATGALHAANDACARSIDAAAEKAKETADMQTQDIYLATELCGETLRAIAAMQTANETAQAAVRLLLPGVDIENETELTAAIVTLPQDAQTAVTQAVLTKGANKSNKERAEETEKSIATGIADIAIQNAGAFGTSAKNIATTAEQNAASDPDAAITNTETALRDMRYAVKAIGCAEQAAKIVPSKAGAAKQAASEAKNSLTQASGTLLSAAQTITATYIARVDAARSAFLPTEDNAATVLTNMTQITDLLARLTYTEELASEAAELGMPEGAAATLTSVRAQILVKALTVADEYAATFYAAYAKERTTLQTAYTAANDLTTDTSKRTEVKNASAALCSATSGATPYARTLNEWLDVTAKVLSYNIPLTQEQRQGLQNVSQNAFKPLLDILEEDAKNAQSGASTCKTRADALSMGTLNWYKKDVEAAQAAAEEATNAASAFHTAAGAANSNYTLLTALLGETN